MNWEALRDRLIRAARQNPPADSVPYAFEKRVLAVLAGSPAPVADDWPVVSRVLGWSAAICSAVALAMGVWSYAPDSRQNRYSEDLEQTIVASFAAHGLEADLDILH